MLYPPGSSEKYHLDVIRIINVFFSDQKIVKKRKKEKRKKKEKKRENLKQIQIPYLKVITRLKNWQTPYLIFPSQRVVIFGTRRISVNWRTIKIVVTQSSNYHTTKTAMESCFTVGITLYSMKLTLYPINFSFRVSDSMRILFGINPIHSGSTSYINVALWRHSVQVLFNGLDRP